MAIITYPRATTNLAQTFSPDPLLYGEIFAELGGAGRDARPLREATGTHGPYERRRGRTGVRPAGIPFAVYHDQEYRERDVDVEAGVPVSGGAGHGNRVKFYELPGTDQVACVVHIGSYDTIGAAYGALMAWVDTNGYRIAGANREVYLIGPGMGTTPEGYVTEVQMPVEKV